MSSPDWMGAASVSGRRKPLESFMRLRRNATPTILVHLFPARQEGQERTPVPTIEASAAFPDMGGNRLMAFDAEATMRAAGILVGQDSGPGDQLDAFLLLAGREFLWQRDGPGAHFAGAVRRYEATSGRILPRPAALPSFVVVKWRGAERRHEVGVWLAGGFLGWLSSPTRRRPRTARDWRADHRVLVALGASHAAARNEPPRSLDGAERRITQLALANIVGASATHAAYRATG